MTKKTDSDNDNGIIRQFNELKKKHPDAMLLFRRNSFYELYKQDAIKAAAVLAIEITDRMLPDYKRPVKVASFPQSALDVYLSRLIRSGIRVAICDALDSPLKKKAGQDKTEINDRTIQNNTDMGKKKKEQGAQETPDRTVENTVDVKPAREKKSKAKAETKGHTGIIACAPLILIIKLNFKYSLLIIFIQIGKIVFTVIKQTIQRAFPINQPLQLFFGPIIFMLLHISLAQQSFSSTFCRSA